MTAMASMDQHKRALEFAQQRVTGAKEKGARQAELENQWSAFARDRYAQAKAKADEALKLAR